MEASECEQLSERLLVFFTPSRLLGPPAPKTPIQPPICTHGKGHTPHTHTHTASEREKTKHTSAVDRATANNVVAVELGAEAVADSNDEHAVVGKLGHGAEGGGLLTAVLRSRAGEETAKLARESA